MSRASNPVSSELTFVATLSVLIAQKRHFLQRDVIRVNFHNKNDILYNLRSNFSQTLTLIKSLRLVHFILTG